MAQYSVQPGDNLTKIARNFQMTLAEFQQMNPGLCEYGTNNCKVLFPGQIVHVRGNDTRSVPRATP